MRAHREVFFRADASPVIGTGHVMRCLSIARSVIARGGRATLIGDCPGDALQQQVARAGADLIDLAGPADLDQARQVSARVFGAGGPGAEALWLVADGYQFDERYLAACAPADRLMVIDDNCHLGSYPVAILLNQSISAERLAYTSPAEPVRLFGPRYAPLRPEFARLRPAAPRPTDPVQRVLVTIGGSDPARLTPHVVRALAEWPAPRLAIRIVMGASSQSGAEVEALVADSPHACEIIRNASNMEELMAWADAAVSAAGTTSWELCCIGVPSVLVSVADNQLRNVADLDARGAAIGVPAASPDLLRVALQRLLSSADERGRMAQVAHDLVDGLGAARVAAHIDHRWLQLRPAEAADARLLWSWANEPDTLRTRFRARDIPWPEHESWFRDTLARSDRALFVAENRGGTPIGQARFDFAGDQATISVSVAAGEQRSGYGSALIFRACDALAARRSLSAVHAYIKSDNAPSQKAFARAGFRHQDDCEFDGHPATHWIWQDSGL